MLGTSIGNALSPEVCAIVNEEKFEIRNSNPETGPNGENLEETWQAPLQTIFGRLCSSFVLVSDFDIRASDLRL